MNGGGGNRPEAIRHLNSLLSDYGLAKRGLRAVEQKVGLVSLQAVRPRHTQIRKIEADYRKARDCKEHTGATIELEGGMANGKKGKKLTVPGKRLVPVMDDAN